jgi:hypothetical protein
MMYSAPGRPPAIRANRNLIEEINHSVEQGEKTNHSVEQGEKINHSVEQGEIIDNINHE